MLTTIFHIMITIPLFEYGIHYVLHKINNNTHKQHHIENHKKENKIENYLLLLIPLYYFGYYLLSLGLCQYWLVHTLIHFYPSVLPYQIVNHHILHHTFGKCNYAVSNPYIDKIFNTYQA